ncbi:MAG: hypothetical protein KGI79_03255 [Patescibacteria group bacterium]|nr:hypothetical protein [Patescibacteria group bacterium]MDE2116867.1 hypothetical protein [Patescibacteria group bacterium]
MASWSARKYGYLLIFVAAVAAIIVIPAYFLFHKAPTCFDGIQNGGETGIDCGGPCARLCPADYAAPKVLWSYSIQVVPGVYNALAYVENSNPTVEAPAVPYLFRLYDAQGGFIAERSGSTFVPAGQPFAVFEGGIETGNRIPAATTFEFTSLPQWRVGSVLTALRTVDANLVQGPSPKAEIDVQNMSVDQTFSNVDAVIVLYDKDNNRVSFSKTVIDSIGPGETKTLYYTWPAAFPESIVRTEVLYIAHPQQ